jgi:excisionase family DNA binding protein
MNPKHETENNLPPRLLLRPQEAANALGVSLRTLMSLVTSGEVPHTRIGERNLRFPLEGLRE